MSPMELLVRVLGITCLTAVLLSGAHRAGADDQVQEWADAHALRLTSRNRGFVRSYLLLGRYLRTVGGVGGIVLGALVAKVTGADVDAGNLWWVWAMGGYLAGAIWAELFLTRPAAPSRAASLSPRRLATYLPARLRWLLRIAGAASVAIGVAVRLGSPARDTLPAMTFADPDLSPTAGLVLGLGGAAIAGAVELLQVRLVRRPQPVVTTDLLAADDAVRASSVHSLAGAGLGMVLIVIATLSTRLVETAGPLPLGLGAAPLVLFLAGLAGWRYYSHRAWRVRRPAPAAP